MRPELCRYTFRRLASTELSLVNDLYNKIYHCNRSGAQAEWLYRHNPYGEPIIIGAFDSSGQLVGMRPAVAATLVRMGYFMEGINTALSLEEGLQLQARHSNSTEGES